MLLRWQLHSFLSPMLSLSVRVITFCGFFVVVVVVVVWCRFLSLSDPVEKPDFVPFFVGVPSFVLVFDGGFDVVVDVVVVVVDVSLSLSVVVANASISFDVDVASDIKFRHSWMKS